MHKATQQLETCILESASTPAMRFSREKRTFDHNRVRFWHFDRKVPATYFPLFEIEREKTSRKTASRLRRVESTFHSKKSKRWKVQKAQKTSPNSPLGPTRLESVPSNHPEPVTRFCATEAWSMLRLRKQFNHQVHHEHKESKACDASSWCPPALSLPAVSDVESVEGAYPLWFTWIRCPACLGTKASPTDRIQQSKHHPFAPFACSCEKIPSERTPTKQTASEKGLLSTACGDFQQKNRHAFFSGVETSMKMTFHSFEQNRSQTREPRGPLSKTPLLFFH